MSSNKPLVRSTKKLVCTRKEVPMSMEEGSHFSDSRQGGHKGYSKERKREKERETERETLKEVSLENLGSLNCS